MSPALLLRCGFVVAFGACALAQEPAAIRPIPPPGIAVPEEVRADLEKGVAALGAEIAALRAKPEMAALLPDVMIFHKAVDWALRYGEFFEAKQFALAKQQLEMGMQRAKELREGQPSWVSATGLVPRGYISNIDGSVQPYGMVVPEDWQPGETTGRRLDFWCHGRGEKLSELDFLNQRLTSKGEFTPPGAFVLHLYGRYCNANKFAGEVDLFEALAEARWHYAIDERKLVIRGFSMGGAAAWQFGTHFAGMWAAVQPGAGFAETREFNQVYAAGKTPPTWWEEVLYRWYDATEYAANLFNTTTVAYSGELDGQKQAADIMLRFARREGEAKGEGERPREPHPGGDGPAQGDGSRGRSPSLVTGLPRGLVMHHLIGPQTAHKIQPETKPEIEAAVAAAVEKPPEKFSKEVRFTTYSLLYPKMEWVEIGRMEQQWERADVRARWESDGIKVETKNVAELRLQLTNQHIKPGRTLVIDGTEVPMTFGKEGDPTVRMMVAVAHKEHGRWMQGGSPPRPTPDEPNRRWGKRPGLCGPIDHAFMDKFLFVRPTGKPLHDKVGAWAAGELEHALGFWRKVFRGEAPVKDDTAITDADIANSNLVLWGDPSSNAVLKKILDRLPLRWTAEKLALLETTEPRMNTDEHGSNPPIRVPSVQIRGEKKIGQTYDSAHHAPVLIFPNPLNPAKYVVLNSGPTFREEALLNNAQQVPKLPDWAIIDLRTPPDGKWPGEVKAAGFFDEQWQAPGK